jgi:hypothetical protein
MTSGQEKIDEFELNLDKNRKWIWRNVSCFSGLCTRLSEVNQYLGGGGGGLKINLNKSELFSHFARLLCVLLYKWKLLGGLMQSPQPPPASDGCIRDRSLIIRQGGLEEKEQKRCKFSMTHPIKVLIFS